MWIIPKNLQLSSGAPDTAGFISDLNEQSQICASSLMVRSKPSPARTWSQKWRRDSWTQHLSGRILKPSHAKPFETEWTSLLVATPASHSAQQESDLEQTTQDIFGHSSQAEFAFFDPSSASLKMSKATSPSDSEKSLETWEQSVTRRRGEYSARVKSARLTSGSASSSWPTIRASEYKDVGPIGSKSHDHMLGKGYLCAVVTQDAANWPTPATADGGKIGNQPNFGQVCLSNHPAIVGIPNREKLEKSRKYGQAALANPSTHGSRQGLSEQDWRTPTVAEEKNQNTSKQIYLQNQVGATPKQWATPRSGRPRTRI